MTEPASEAARALTEQEAVEFAALTIECRDMDRDQLLRRIFHLEADRLDLRSQVAGLIGDLELAKDNEKHARMDLREAMKGKP